MLPQQPTGLIFVLLGDDLPPLIPQQHHKEPTRRIPHSPRMHSGSHHVSCAASPPPASQQATARSLAGAGRASGPHRRVVYPTAADNSMGLKTR